jgi:hypothetical protein
MAATTDTMTVPTADGWNELRASAKAQLAAATKKCQDVHADSESLIAAAHRHLLDTKASAATDRRVAREAVLLAEENVRRCNRACGLNADGTERKQRARKGAPETEQATLPETTGGATA